MKFIKIITLFALTIITSTCFAQKTFSKVERETTWTYNKYDSNKDQFLTKEEVKGDDILKWFSNYDFDNDGKISISEFKRNKFEYLSGVQAKLKKELAVSGKPSDGKPWERFSKLDKSNDGHLSEDEYFKRKLMLSYEFEEVDIDENNSLNFEEFKSSFNDWRYSKIIKKRRKKHVIKPRFNYEKLSVNELFYKFDKDYNNKIERSEAKLERSFNTDFSRMDTNGDEIVNKKELKIYLASKK